MTKTAIYNHINRFSYLYKRNNWMVDIPSYFKSFNHIKIDRPIFLLGTQGGGLTLISRMLRRHRNVVSVTGNHNYWSGADEMQNVLGPILPPQLTGIKYKVPQHPSYGSPREWTYANDDLLPLYRSKEQDADDWSKRNLEKIIKRSIAKHAIDIQDARFTDKSQLYTIKIPYLNKLLEEYNPFFLLITRNPYAICFSRAQKTPSLKSLEKTLSLESRIALAAQHWANSIETALQDGKNVANFLTISFEEVLERPSDSLQKICNFVQLEYSDEMIPQPHHSIPFGSMRRDRWYPIRPNVNESSLKKITAEQVEIIDKYCGRLAQEVGYTKPSF